MISAPALAIYIAGMRLGFFPRFRLVAVDIAVVLLQLLAIKELLRMYLDFYAAYFFKREHNGGHQWAHALCDPLNAQVRSHYLNIPILLL